MTDSLERNAARIVETLRARGHDAYYVGGCVRDRVMGIKPNDYDVATSARPEQVQETFKRTVAVGEAFGVVNVALNGHTYEVATFRSDGVYHDGRRPAEVAYGTAREDVRRRDFTINGMLQDPADGTVIDWVGGQEDIRKRVVRTIGDPMRRFDEDRLRMLRAVRFAARFEYRLDESTERAIKDLAPGLDAISKERVGDELVKTLVGPHAGLGLELMERTGLLGVCLPEAQAMVGVEQPKKFHPEGDVFRHTCMMLDMLDSPSPELALATLLHDVGKPPTFKVSDRIRFNEHDKAGAEIARGICERLRFSKARARAVTSMVENHMRFAMAHRMKLSTLKKLMAMPRFEEHLELHRLDCLASHGSLDNYHYIKDRMEAMTEEEIEPAPLLTGHDLIEMGYQPGPVFREILSAVRERQLDGEIKRPDEAAAFVRERYPLAGIKDSQAPGQAVHPRRRRQA